MTLVTLIGFKFSIHFQQGDVRVASVQVTNPFKLGFGMGIRMRRMRPMRFIGQGLTGSVKALVPTHKRSFRDVVTRHGLQYPVPSS